MDEFQYNQCTELRESTQRKAISLRRRSKRANILDEEKRKENFFRVKNIFANSDTLDEMLMKIEKYFEGAWIASDSCLRMIYEAEGNGIKEQLGKSSRQLQMRRSIVDKEFIILQQMFEDSQNLDVMMIRMEEYLNQR